MLLTPCRFPVVLGIVPMCKGGSALRGVALALVFAGRSDRHADIVGCRHRWRRPAVRAARSCEISFSRRRCRGLLVWMVDARARQSANALRGAVVSLRIAHPIRIPGRICHGVTTWKHGTVLSRSGLSQHGALYRGAWAAHRRRRSRRGVRTGPRHTTCGDRRCWQEGVWMPFNWPCAISSDSIALLHGRSSRPEPSRCTGIAAFRTASCLPCRSWCYRRLSITSSCKREFHVPQHGSAQRPLGRLSEFA